MRVKSLTVAYDIGLITTDEEDANEIANSINEHSRKCGMEINLADTKVMTNIGGTRKLKVELGYQ